MTLYHRFSMLEIGGKFMCSFSSHFGLFFCMLAHKLLLLETHTSAMRKAFHYECVV
jgi:hypothetical protein